MKVSSVFDKLSTDLARIPFALPVAHVYNPLRYARTPHLLYWEKFGGSPKEAVFLGMNPGPWGMAQTGVPFGEVNMVRDWMGIEAPVDHPENEHPLRVVTGFSCRRSEVSGKRLWGLAAQRFGTAERFFSRFFVANYCPLLFLEAGGKNLTPDKIAAADREALTAACDEALRSVVEKLGAPLVVGVGGYAAQRATLALAGTGIRVGRITHPSPANPAANRGWTALVDAELLQLGIDFR
jgi:single-strand selective monofunctional uracil DNA glycosylase